MNTLEERILNELRAERELVPPAEPGATPMRASRWPRYSGVAAAVATIVGGVALVSLPEPAPSGMIRVESLTLAASIDGTEVTVGDYPVFYGLIETEDLEFVPDGDEQPLVQEHPMPIDVSEWEHLDPDGPSIYVGELPGGSAFVIEPTSASVEPVGRPGGELGEAPSFLRRLFGRQVEADNHPVCLAVLGDRSTMSRLECFPEGGASIVTVSSTSEIWDEVWWLGVPPGTAVVTASIGEHTIWQRPSGSVSVIRFDAAATGDLTVTALDRNGNALARHTPER